MKTSTYSFGEDSPLKFQISDKLARYYNEAAEEYLKAQQRFNQKFGRQWDPNRDPIGIRWSRKHKWAWNEFAKIYKKTLDESGPYHENDLMDDLLVKNTARSVTNNVSSGGGLVIGGLVSVTPLRGTGKLERILTLAVVGGVLYGFLKTNNNSSGRG